MIRRLHLIFGGLLFVAFLVTGQFMRRDFPDKDAIEQEFRLLMRSRHLYILLLAIVNLMLGLYLSLSVSLIRRSLQMAGSFFMIAAGVGMVYAFAFETYSAGHFTNVSRYVLFAALAGAVLHVFGGFRLKSNDNV